MIDHGRLMDGVYRRQRHIYDLTRKYYLLGRDGLVRDLDLADGGHVLEIGCGTGRNLVTIGKAWPAAQLYGVDISKEMLATAQASITKAGLSARTRLVQGDACDFDAASLLGRPSFDRVVISYALSMVPDWRRALVQAARCVSPGGRLEIVDFGRQESWPAIWKRGLQAWLDRFHVSPRHDLPAAVADLATAVGATASSRSLHGGYAIRATLQAGPQWS